MVFDRLSKVPGLTPIMPRGSMYTLVRCSSVKYSMLGVMISACSQVGIDQKQHAGFKDDYDFTERLYSEMSVRCIPGKVNKSSMLMFIILLLIYLTNFDCLGFQGSWVLSHCPVCFSSQIN